MKLKNLLFISSGLATVALIALVFSNISADIVKADYSTREAQAPQEGIKGAQEYYQLIKSNVNTGKIEPEDFQRTRKALKQTNMKSSDINWIEMGPDNVGGRTRALAAVDNNTLYAGSVSGGLWVTYNAGNNWSRVEGFGGASDLADNLMVSSLAIAGNGDILVGTGSRFESGGNGSGGSGFLGGGLYISTDDGDSFELVEGTQPILFSGNADWAYIEQLRTDPNDPNRVWIAFNGGLGYYDVDTQELYDPQEQGALSGLSSGRIDDLQIAADGSVMTVVTGFNSIFRSLDGGQNWESSNTSPFPVNIGRLEMAISPDDSNYMYALCATNGGSMAGAFASTDKGATWFEIWPGGTFYEPFGSNGQGNYDNIVIVKKGDPETAFFGGVTLWKCGATTQQPEIIASNFAFGTSNLYVHSDIHEFLYTDDGTLYIGTDGGVFKSNDNGQTFSTASKGYNTIQFYDIDHSPRDAVMGGTQDNGTLFIPNDGTFLSDLSARSVLGGDGFGTEISQVTANNEISYFASLYYGDLRRISGVGEPSNFYSGDLESLFIENGGEIDQFYTCIGLYENTDDPNSQQYVELVNPYDSTFVSDEPTDFPVFTANLSMPFTYTLPAGDSLRYWDELVRPEVIYDEELGEFDPEYFWLEAQILDEIIVECDTVDSTLTGTETEEILNPIDSCYVLQTGPETDTTICITIGYDTTFVETDIYDYTVECDSMYRYAADVVPEVHERIRVLDTYTTMLAIGFSGSNGVWLTRQGLNFNTTPEWFKVVPSVGGGYVTDIEFSRDGNHMFYTTTGGRAYRLDGLQELWSQEDVADLPSPVQIATSGSVAMDIAVDPNDKDHVIIAYGNYGGGSKVRRSVNATSANPTFSNVWSLDNPDLNGMPCYSALIDVNNSDRYFVGTEFGMYVSEDAGDSWEQCNSADMEKVPVFSLQQQIFDNERYIDANNAGYVYAGTHGRGAFKTEDFTFTNVDEYGGSEDDEAQHQLLIYPNPSSNSATLNFTAKENIEDTRIRIFNVRGSLIKEVRKGSMTKGEQSVQLDFSDLPVGNYILNLEAGTSSGVSKFVIMR